MARRPRFRPLATDRALASTVRAFLRHQRDPVLLSILRNIVVDLSAWVQPMSDAVQPHMQRIVGSAFRDMLKTLVTGRSEPEGRRPARHYPFGIDVPEVREYIRTMSVNFSISVNRTSAEHAREDQHVFRTELAEGIEKGEAQAKLTSRLNRIFRNPARTAMIAQTESARSLNGGQFLAVKRMAGTWVKRWLESSDACPRCVALGAMGEIPIDQTFYVDQSGPYSIVNHPPLHPNCMCTVVFSPA